MNRAAAKAVKSALVMPISCPLTSKTPSPSAVTISSTGTRKCLYFTVLRLILKKR